MVWMASLAIGAIPGGSGGGADRGAYDGGGEESGPTETGGIDALGPTGGGGMLGAETRGATGAADAWDPACGTFGAIGALGASGPFVCGRKSEDATRTAGSAASALPEGVFPDLRPV